MAVDASHITLFSPQNREMIYQGSESRFDNQFYGSKTENVLPMYDSDSFLPTDFRLSRKRSRDSSSFDPMYAPNVNINGHQFGEFTFLGEDVSLQIYQQQLDIDRLIAHHTEKMRAEIEEMRKQNTRLLIAAIHNGITKQLKTKDEQIMKIGELNWSLEEQVKTLTVENIILRDLVQTNESTANALRNKLQQVLAHVQQQQNNINYGHNVAKAGTLLMVDDGESECGSNNEEEGKNDDDCKSKSRYGWCRKCGKEESCVLLLPCRHLCVCSLCVSSVSFCPVCNSTKSAAVLVNMNPF